VKGTENGSKIIYSNPHDETKTLLLNHIPFISVINPFNPVARCRNSILFLNSSDQDQRAPVGAL